MTVPINNNNVEQILESIAQPQIQKGLNVLNKYAEIFNGTARQQCTPYYEVVKHNYEAEPIEDVVTIYRPHTRRAPYRIFSYYHNLIIKFGIRYTQDVGNSAYFGWIDGNDYFGSINEGFKIEFGELYHGFSQPVFIEESNCYMSNHSQTFRMETIIDLSQEISEEEFYEIRDRIE